MAIKSSKLSWLLAVLFLAVNVLAVFPMQASAADGFLFDTDTSDFENSASAVSFYQYSGAKTPPTFTVSDGAGINGSGGGTITIDPGTSQGNHRIQCKNKMTLYSGKTYHFSAWLRTDTEKIASNLQIYCGGYTIDGTVNGETVTNADIYFNTELVAVNDDWAHYTLNLTVDKIYNGSGEEVSDTGANTSYFMPVQRFGDVAGVITADLRYVTSVSVDGLYVIEESSADSANYARAQAANAKVTSETGYTEGSVLKASATVADANPNAAVSTSYKWQISDNGTDFTDIEGESAAEYTVKSGDVNKYVRAVVTAESTGAANGATSMSSTSSAVEITPVPTEVTVTVTANEGGKIIYNGAEVSGDVAVPFDSSESQLFTIQADEGYEVESVKVDGVSIPDFSGGIDFKGLRTAKTLDVTFAKKKIAPGFAENITTTQFSSVDGTPTIYVYSKLNDFTTAGGEEYGINLWIQGDKANSIKLAAMSDSDTVAAAAPGQAYAIKVYGNAITADKTYEAQAYVGDATDTVKVIEFK